MIERAIIFIVFGSFVFTPAISDWWQQGFVNWYEIYIPWLLLIVVTAVLQFSRETD